MTQEYINNGRKYDPHKTKKQNENRNVRNVWTDKTMTKGIKTGAKTQYTKQS